MTCPDWRQLLAHRFDPALATPARWTAAQAHLEDCAECRRQALAIDPTLAFRGAAAWTSTPGESAAIIQAVHTLRRTGELEHRAEQGRAPSPGARSREHGPLAAAALFALILAFQPATTSRNRNESTTLLLERPAAAALQRASRPEEPAIEGIDRPGARVYEWGAEDLSVVMVVDESLDV